MRTLLLSESDLARLFPPQQNAHVIDFYTFRRNRAARDFRVKFSNLILETGSVIAALKEMESSQA